MLFEPPEGINCRSWPAVVDIDENFYFKPEGEIYLDHQLMKPLLNLRMQTPGLGSCHCC